MAGIHFFVDDYQFNRVWMRPDMYLRPLRSFAAVCSPDFSLYTDMPLALQLYNHYRKHWLGAYWQMHGITVIPTISWSTVDSYEWCFDGEPTHSIVAVSSVGCVHSAAEKRLFVMGYKRMVEQLSPSKVLFHGIVPPECYKLTVIEPLPSFVDKF